MPTPDETFRVSVYCDTREEADLAAGILQRLGKPQVYDGLVDGLADAAAVTELEQASLIVARPTGVPPSSAPVLESAVFHADGSIAKGDALGRIDPADAPELGAYDITLGRPFSQVERVYLQQDLGVRIVEKPRPDVLRLIMTPEQLADVQNLSPVRGIQLKGGEQPSQSAVFHAARGLTPQAIDAHSRELESFTVDDDVEKEFSLPETYQAIIIDPGDLKQVAELVEGAGATVESASDIFLTFSTDDRQLADNLRKFPKVASVDLTEPPSKLYADFARRVIGLEALSVVSQVTPSSEPLELNGAGQKVAVFDSGIDPGHPDLAPNVVLNQVLPGALATDEFGHGTHVAGIIAGTGAASGGKIRGAAPGAKLLIYSIVDGNRTPLLPPNLGDLLQRAVDEGAKIINLSLGYKIGGAYNNGSLSLDRFIYRNPDVLVVVAAGNEGKLKDGQLDFKTLGPPASAKNALSVGASCTDRPGIYITWAGRYPDRFPLRPLSEATVAGNPHLCAAFSSRGPTDFQRVKPDVVAPGTYILAPRSRTFDPLLAWDAFSDFKLAGGEDAYVFIGGTSMATPLVAGAAAVLRQYLVDVRGLPNPSAALLKAILIASTEKITPNPSDPPFDAGYPDFDQGYGLVNLANVFPVEGRTLELVDVPNGKASPEALLSRMEYGAERKSSRTYLARVDAGATGPLTVVLAYTDQGGISLQNNLQLDVKGPGFLDVGNSARKVFRDAFLAADLNGIPYDAFNNVEMVRVEQPKAGTYRISVRAQDTPDLEFPQGYALCVCGPLREPLRPMV